MIILMLGWEFPPHITGGLGVASQGIAEGLAKKGHEIHFLLPKKNEDQVSKNVKLIDISEIKPDMHLWGKEVEKEHFFDEIKLGTRILPYLPPETFFNSRTISSKTKEIQESTEFEFLESTELTGKYNGQLQAEISKFAMLATQYVLHSNVNFDAVHAHDWVTFLGGKMIQSAIMIPFVAHVHSIEYERNGQFPQRVAIESEKEGLVAADHIISVSRKTKKAIVDSYDINETKIAVVPNAVNVKPSPKKSRKPNTIGFIGRFTHQKNPFAFLDLARNLTSKGHDFDFVMYGDGHLKNDLVHKSSTANLEVRFPGFLSREKLLGQLPKLDLLIVPSNDEPFGLVTLEAINKLVPVAASYGSGIAEFIPSLPQVELWNHFGFVSLIERLMTDTKYRETVTAKCFEEAKNLSWDKSSEMVASLYTSLD